MCIDLVRHELIITKYPGGTRFAAVAHVAAGRVSVMKESSNRQRGVCLSIHARFPRVELRRENFTI